MTTPAKTVKHKVTKTAKKHTEKKHEKKPILPYVAKITINIGVGESGEKLKKAETVLQKVSGQKPIQTLSKTTSKDWGLRKDMPIGCKVTLRKKIAEKFLIEALKTRENKISDYSFDDQGNFSFGVPDHTLFEGQKYDPSIGIFGMDVCVTIEKPGYRVKHRRIDARKIPKKHQVNREEAMKLLTDQYKAEVIT
jgi:large subunit ribosomal protein L5